MLNFRIITTGDTISASSIDDAYDQLGAHPETFIELVPDIFDDEMDTTEHQDRPQDSDRGGW